MISTKCNFLTKLKLRHTVILLLALTAVSFLWNNYVEPRMPYIAKIEINGVIGDNPKLLETIEKVENDNAAKALIVSIYSGGGSVHGSEEIYNALQKVKKNKPVIAHVKAMALSGGYLISCAANAIVAAGSSTVGSIGALYAVPQLKPLLDKLGVSIFTVKSSPLKAEPSLYTNISKDSIRLLEEMVDEAYQSFVQIVSKSRNLSYKETLTLADGRIYSGKKAKKLGLIDVIGGNEEILSMLSSKWKIDKKALRIKNLSSTQSYWERLSNGSIMGYIMGGLIPNTENGYSGLLAISPYQ
ncbi:signal peptide peptidase SppA [Candidatus Liberibacter americanus]|uniref:Periplasmic serine protease n=1 Tax=Candidatus Liberibacter americanus str. Sao Paulo TaxID=1261131 RepID=U6B3R8_9HYPH|nr:signal peptide peptidase SppA [Candidatus Liberibacter americanus]AHA27585.1 Periplasmic serine protease [Candidatus Liberibacter americanus str. Sao Paulo]EMS36454.1 putative protease IV transmembrane protein [Candidatus Liberibacter americanus PW_SP]